MVSARRGLDVGRDCKRYNGDWAGCKGRFVGLPSDLGCVYILRGCRGIEEVRLSQ